MNKSVRFFFVVCFLSIPVFTKPNTYAQENLDYQLQINNIDINPAQPAIESFQENKNEESDQNPKPIIERGFQNSNSQEPLVFSISQDFMDFGILDPTNPVIRSHQFTLIKGASKGASLFGFKDQLLTDSQSKSTIPDTTCDDGTCTAETGSTWENTLTYGFGFKTSDSNYYKRIVNKSNSYSISSIIPPLYDQKKEFEVTYKVNISGTQKPGTYQSSMTYIVLPTL